MVFCCHPDKVSFVIVLEELAQGKPSRIPVITLKKTHPEEGVFRMAGSHVSRGRWPQAHDKVYRRSSHHLHVSPWVLFENQPSRHSRIMRVAYQPHL